MTTICCELDSKKFQCIPIRDGVQYVGTPYTKGYDPETIGAYVLRKADGRLFVTDDGNQMMTAMSHGMTLSKRKIDTLNDLLSSYQISLRQNGEVAGWCDEKNLTDFLFRYFEASIRLSDEIWNMLPSLITHSFDLQKKLGAIFDSNEPIKKRIRKNVELIGISGHQLSFPFVLDFGTPYQKIIQPLSGANGKPKWESVMQTLGKLVDLHAATGSLNARAIVVVQPVEKKRSLQEIQTALVDHASVIELKNRNQFLEQIVA